MNKPADPSVSSVEGRLVEQAAAGDRQAQQALFERYRDVAYRVARRIVGRHEDALDVVQDGFIRAFERLESFEGQARFKTWLLRIVSNRALDVLRSRKVRLAVSLDGRTGAGDDDAGRLELASDHEEDRPETGLLRGELGERIAAALETLPPEQRTVFALYAAGEMTYGDIAEAVGVPIGTVMSRLYHARQKLHKLLADLAPTGRRSEAADD